MDFLQLKTLIYHSNKYFGKFGDNGFPAVHDNDKKKLLSHLVIFDTTQLLNTDSRVQNLLSRITC